MYPLPSACEHAYAKQVYMLINLLELINKVNSTQFNVWRHELQTVINQAQKQDSRRYNKWATIAKTMMLEI